MNSLTPGRKILATGAFLTLALSPSFLDWQQSPEKRRQFIAFYGAALTMFWFGLLR